MASVVIKNLRKSFLDKKTGDIKQVVKGVNLEIADKEFFILVGASGCGKSTTLRLIAGLEEVEEGDISISGRVVNDVPPKDRDIAMVFQNYALYPHMTVYENMAFGLKLRRLPKDEIDRRVREAAQILNITDKLDKKPGALSGGQRQRVALGRCIVRKAQVFLFDEPLSNLDAKLRAQMRVELIKLHESLQTTMIYVTHDQVEAMTMGDRICVMEEGIVQQVAPPMEIYNHPANQFVAEFIGSPSMNLFNVKIEAVKDEVVLRHSHFTLTVPPMYKDQVKKHVGTDAVLGVRPEDMYDRLFYAYPVTEGTTLKAKVDVVEPLGSEIFLSMRFNADKAAFVVRVPPHVQTKVNQEIEIVVNMEKMHLFANAGAGRKTANVSLLTKVIKPVSAPAAPAKPASPPSSSPSAKG